MAGMQAADLAVLQQSQGKLQDAYSEINGRLNSLMGQLEPLASEFKGNAAASFQQVKERWAEDLKKLNQALDVISVKLGESAKGHAAVDEAQAQSLNSVGQGLGGGLGI